MHISIWTLFMASSMKAALHMDPNYAKNLEIFKNSEFENIESLFNVTKMMIAGNSEIKNIFPKDSANPSWERPTLPTDQTIVWTKARVSVCSDSMLCLRIMLDPEETVKRWKGQLSTLQMFQPYRELRGLNGEPIEFEWKIF